MSRETINVVTWLEEWFFKKIKIVTSGEDVRLREVTFGGDFKAIIA